MGNFKVILGISTINLYSFFLTENFQNYFILDKYEFFKSF